MNGVTFDELVDIRSLIRTSGEPSLRDVGVAEIIRGVGAISELAQVLRRRGVDEAASVVVLSDTTPKRSGGDDVLDTAMAALRSSFRVHLHRVAPRPPATIVLADEITVGTATEQVRLLAGNVLVTVGSGTMADISKVVARELGLTHVIVQTAASVNGFTDDQSVVLINGTKRTTPSKWPDAVVIDDLVLADAPIEMTRAGLGDQLSMYSASADWYLSSALGFDTSFSPTLVSLMRRDMGELVSMAADLNDRQPAAVSRLASCLALGGLSVGVAGRTAPSSGTEHVVSHLLEIHGDAHHPATPSHGSQVGVASVLAAIVWQRVRDTLIKGGQRIEVPSEDVRTRVFQVFGDLDDTGATSHECWTGYERKLRWMQSHRTELQRFVDEWAIYDDVVDQLLTPASFIASTLRAAGAPVTFNELYPVPSRDVVVWAVAHCHLMRDRFTVIDLADLVGAWSPDDVDASLEALDVFSQ